MLKERLVLSVGVLALFPLNDGELTVLLVKLGEPVAALLLPLVIGVLLEIFGILEVGETLEVVGSELAVLPVAPPSVGFGYQPNAIFTELKQGKTSRSKKH